MKRWQTNTFAWLLAVGGALGAQACADTDPDEEADASSTSSSTSPDSEGGPTSGDSLDPQTETASGGSTTADPSNTAGEETGTSDGSESTGDDDPGLAEWPQPYQDFINSVGGSKFAMVDGVRMHYIETGDTSAEDVVLLIHGIPVHAYLWRDVLPSFGDQHVIAVDLVGYGRSDRPSDLDYTPATHVDFLAGFADALDLQHVDLVTHDLGGVVGMRWAFENQARVESITMFETIWATIPSIADVPPPFGELLAGLRDPELGPVLIGEMNVFLAMLDAFTVTGVAEQDEEVYQYPFLDAQDRIDVILPSGPLAFPFAEDPAAEQFVAEYSDYLASDDIPKLVIDVPMGPVSNITTRDAAGDPIRMPDYAIAAFENTTAVTLDGAGHFVQEDLPEELGAAIAEFVE